MNPRIRLEPSAASGAHRGLLLDKYLTVKTKKGDSHAEALKAVSSASPAAMAAAYKLAYERWHELSKRLPNAVRLKGRIRGRMATGLGNKNITEIGCTLHRTYGVPMIPGSSVKGVLRGAMESARSESEVWRKRAAFLFGSEDARGFATVYDAWWIPESGKSGLALDVLTPHHSSYYTGGEPVSPPTDFESPVPNHFLTVTGQFWFVAEAPNESWRGFLEKLLRQTLTENGVGAKRTSGYGRFDQFVIE